MCNTDLILPAWAAKSTAAALQLATELAQKSPVALRATKIYMLHGRDHRYVGLCC
jgi:enoyl-CoA hydratase/carnithine racemase